MEDIFNQPTEMVHIRDVSRQQREIQRAAQLLKSGELVAFPTETV